MLDQLEWLGRRWVRWVLSPGLTLLPKPAERWADWGTHQKPPPALQSSLLSTADALCIIGKLLPGHAAVPMGSCSPFPSPGTALGHWEQPVPSLPAGSTCSSHASPGKTHINVGPRDTLGTAIRVERAHGRGAAEWGGICWRKPLRTLPVLAGDMVLLGERHPNLMSH